MGGDVRETRNIKKGFAAMGFDYNCLFEFVAVF